jgi:hypothetical protein
MGASAGSQTTWPDDPAAKEELRLCAEVYRRMPAYSDQGNVELKARINGQARSENSPIRLTFQRPDKVKIYTERMRMIVDGGRLAAEVDFTRKYAEGTALGYDLRLMRPVDDVRGMPQEGKALVIVAAVQGTLRFRIFDPHGKKVVDTDEKSLPKKAPQIEDLKKQLESQWPPHELTRDEKERLCTAVTSIVGYTPAPNISAQGLLETPIGPAFLGGTAGIPPWLILSLLSDEDPVATILADAVGLKLLSRGTQTCLKVDQKQGPDIAIYLDAQTRQVAKIHLILQPEEYFGRIPPGVDIADMELIWTPGKVSQETPAPDSFSYRPSPKFKRVGFAEIFTADQEGPGVQDGQPAPQIESLPAIHRAAPVTSKGDLKDRVAILLFWATWSPASFHQLFDTLRLLEKHRDQEVVLLAISLDDEEPANVEQKIAALFKQKGLDSKLVPGVILALDPKNSVGMVYHIRSIPTTVLIDRQGDVRKQIVGYTKEGLNLLDQEIQALGRPVRAPGP